MSSGHLVVMAAATGMALITTALVIRRWSFEILKEMGVDGDTYTPQTTSYFLKEEEVDSEEIPLFI